MDTRRYEDDDRIDAQRIIADILVTVIATEDYLSYILDYVKENIEGVGEYDAPDTYHYDDLEDSMYEVSDAISNATQWLIKAEDVLGSPDTGSEILYDYEIDKHEIKKRGTTSVMSHIVVVLDFMASLLSVIVTQSKAGRVTPEYETVKSLPHIRNARRYLVLAKSKSLPVLQQLERM